MRFIQNVPEDKHMPSENYVSDVFGLVSGLDGGFICFVHLDFPDLHI